MGQILGLYVARRGLLSTAREYWYEGDGRIVLYWSNSHTKETMQKIG